MLLLAFFCVLMVQPLVADVEQACIERTVLMRLLGRARRRPVIRLLLQMGLMMRRLLLPVLTVTAGAAVVVTNPLDSQNIFLNTMSVVFITEADDMFAKVPNPPSNAASTLSSRLHIAGLPARLTPDHRG